MATVGYICNDILARSIKAGSDAAQFVPRQARVPLSTWSAFKLEWAGDAADRTRRLQPSNGPPWTDPRVEVEALVRMALFAHITAPGTRYNKDGVGHAPALRQQWTCPPAAGSGHGAERQSNALGEDAEALPSRVQCGPFAESRESLVPPSTHAALRRSSHTSLNACNGRTSKVRLQRAVLRDEVLCSISAVSQAGRCAALRAPRRAHLPEVVPAEQHELILTDAHH